MLKILYAASNNENSKIQLFRFLKAMVNKPFIVKIAAYKKSSPHHANIDWTLDCLLNIFRPDHISTDNDNFSIYFNQVKSFNPDLIISDMEYFTSYIANVLNITLWQCSSSLINFAVTQNQKYNLGLFKKYSYLSSRNSFQVQRQVNMIDNANCNFVYSHFGDLHDAPPLKENYEWIRPYHTLGKISIPCQHNLVAGMLSNNKRILSFLKRYPDTVAFTSFNSESYSSPLLKDIENEEEYFCNLRNSDMFVCEGQTSFLADAYYNNKYSIVLTNFRDLECITNSMYSQQLGLSTSIYDLSEEINKSNINSSYNKHIEFLHEKIEKL
jgi:hypothetical protein